MPLPQNERRYALVLLIVSVGVLAAGTYVRRRTAPSQAAPAPPNLEILQRLTAERRLRDLSEYLSQTAAAHGRRLLSPAGLAWDTGVVLAPTAPLDRAAMAAVAVDGRPVALARAAAPLGVPFSVWRAPAGAGLPAAAPAQPKPGDWVLAVARNQAGAPVFAQGTFQGIVKERCGAFEYDAVTSGTALSAALVGGGIFTQDGAVAAFIADCAGRPIAVAASTVADVLSHRLSQSDVLEQSYGFRLADEPPDLVIAVWMDSPAAAAGLQPGDIVTLGNQLPPTARRGRRTVKLDWSAAAPAPSAPRGITFEGNVVRAVAPGTPAAAAGIVPGDTIVEPPDAARALERANGMVAVTVERNGRRRRTLLQP
jgi:hypothetical protein